MKTATKKKLKQGAKTFAFKLLEAIKGLGEMMPRPFESKYEHQRRLRRMIAGYYTPQKISRTLFELKTQGLIKPQQSKNQFAYQLTVAGRQKLLIKQLTKGKTRSLDGFSCIIAFDIPEAKKKHRRFLRRLLLQNGFINLQKSVLIGPEFLPDEFSKLLTDLGLRQNVTIIKGQVLYQ